MKTRPNIRYTAKDKVVVMKVAGAVFVAFMMWVTMPMITPFVSQFFIGAVLASALYPTVYQPLSEFLGGRAKTAIAIMIMSFIGMCFIVMVGFGVYGINKIDTGIEAVKDGSTMVTEFQEEAVDLLVKVKKKHEWSTMFVDKAIEIADSNFGSVTVLLQGGGMIGKLSKSVLGAVTGTLAKVWKIFVDISITVVAVIIFLLRGKKMIEWLLPHIAFFGKEDTRQILLDVQKVMNSLVKSMVAVGLGQGGLATLIVGIYCFMYMPVDIAVLLVIAILAIATSACGLPLVATPVVIGLVVISAVQGHYIATGVLLVATVLVATCDNWIKFKVLGGEEATLSAVALMLCMIAGMNAYGLKGALVGPFLVAFLVSLIIAFKKDIDILKGDEEEKSEEITAEVTT
ncbi:MAG: AI-2E family transporter [Candidatus Moraniibacteriota bacterium]